MRARRNEWRCAELIAKVRRGFRPSSVGMQLVTPGEYSDAEIRVANESLERLGYQARIAAGTITIHPDDRSAATSRFRAGETRIMRLGEGDR